jgi:ethanolamine kinase
LQNATLKIFYFFQVVFIDLEYGGPAPAAFDIANHMCEFVGCEGELDYERWFPARSYQLDWLTLYLTEFNRIQNKEPPSESQVCDLCTSDVPVSTLLR